MVSKTVENSRTKSVPQKESKKTASSNAGLLFLGLAAAFGGLTLLQENPEEVVPPVEPPKLLLDQLKVHYSQRQFSEKQIFLIEGTNEDEVFVFIPIPAPGEKDRKYVVGVVHTGAWQKSAHVEWFNNKQFIIKQPEEDPNVGLLVRLEINGAVTNTYINLKEPNRVPGDVWIDGESGSGMRHYFVSLFKEIPEARILEEFIRQAFRAKVGA